MSSHLQLFFSSLILISIFLVYLYVSNDRQDLELESDKDLFTKEGFTEEEISKLTHDDKLWYYNGNSTCICYFNNENNCINAGDLPGQIKVLKETIRENNGIVKNCPLI